MMMNRILCAAGLLLAFAGVSDAQNSPASKMAPQKGWLFDLNAGKAQARKTGKPLMVVFRCDP